MNEIDAVEALSDASPVADADAPLTREQHRLLDRILREIPKRIERLARAREDGSA